MKKILALMIALLMLAMCFTACGETGDNGDTTTPADNAETTTGADTTTGETEAETTAPSYSYNDTLELLNQVVEKYNEKASEETKLYVCGGNINNFETVNPEGPAKFVALEDANYDTELGVPASEVSKFDEASSMYNMMNTSVFNSYALHLTSGTDASALAESIKTNILDRQWVCGAPEKIVIMSVPGDYLLVVWGAVSFGGIVDPVVESITTNFGATTLASFNIE